MCFVHQGEIYKPEEPYDENWPAYDHLMPALDSCVPDGERHTKKEMGILDCWVCDRDGNICPGYCNAPVPVAVAELGDFVSEGRE